MTKPTGQPLGAENHFWERASARQAPTIERCEIVPINERLRERADGHNFCLEPLSRARPEWVGSRPLRGPWLRALLRGASVFGQARKQSIGCISIKYG